MKLFENEFVEISLDVTTPCLEWVGKKFVPSEEFRLSEKKSLEFFKQYKSEYPNMPWFVDARDIGPVSPSDTEWVAKNILPEFAAAGLKKEVFVVPKSALGKMAVNTYISEAGQTIEMSVFDNVADAKNWLKE